MTTLQPASLPSSPSADIVGHAFVEQYYHILHQNPESVYKFYEESSTISRPDASGSMTTATTKEGINEKVLSLNYKEYKAEIKTADAQKSYMDGVTVLVTGVLTSKDQSRRKFTQSFFLAPQNNGYFVLNDVFRYVDDNEMSASYLATEMTTSPTAPLTPDPEPAHVSESHAPETTTSLLVNGNKAVVEQMQDNLENDIQSVDDIVNVVETQSNSNGYTKPPVAESSSSALEDTHKKSYASILSAKANTSRPQVTKKSVGQNKVHAPANSVRALPANTDKQSSVSVAPPPVPARQSGSSISPLTSNNSQDEVEGHSVYVRNLPFGLHVSDLEAAFHKFGPIKKGGVQVRNYMHIGHCFGFVEFLSSSSMESAIQASPVPVGGRQATVEIKKTTTRAGDMGKYFTGRGGYRNDGFRGQGNFGGGRGYGRNDFSGRGTVITSKEEGDIAVQLHLKRILLRRDPFGKKQLFGNFLCVSGDFGP